MQSFETPRFVYDFVEKVSNIVGVPIAFEWDENIETLKLVANIEAPVELTVGFIDHTENAVGHVAEKIRNDLLKQLRKLQAKG